MLWWLILGSSCRSRDRYPWLTVHQLPDMLELYSLMWWALRDRFLRGQFHSLWLMLHCDALPRFKRLPWLQWRRLHHLRKLARCRFPL